MNGEGSAGKFVSSCVEIAQQEQGKQIEGPLKMTGWHAREYCSKKKKDGGEYWIAEWEDFLTAVFLVVASRNKEFCNKMRWPAVVN